MLVLYLFGLFFSVSNAIYYDSYTGKQITQADVTRHIKENNTFWCVNDINPCDPKEGRRVDGSCNNLKYPTRGATHTPFINLLPTVYTKTGPTKYDPIKDSKGNDLPPAWVVKDHVTKMGKVTGTTFTTLALHYWVLMAADITSLQDTVNYILWKPYCCSEKGKTDDECIPNMIPEDDPIHRVTGIGCLNLTRPESFQSNGCTRNTTTPNRIVSSTPYMDLSTIYGNNEKSLLEKGRSFKGGLLKVEEENGLIWPPSAKTVPNLCYLNQLPKETRCHAMPEDGPNTLIGINLMSIWFWRHHNVIASELAKVNPCWDDQKLFETARDINIAIADQIMYYELMPEFLGYDRMVRDGILNPKGDHCDVYNPNKLPGISNEYPQTLRWCHTLQPGQMERYNTNGSYLGTIPFTVLTLRTGWLAIDNNLKEATHSSFTQACAKPDNILDPEMVLQVLGPFQKMSDVMTDDITKARYFGIPTYTHYRELFYGKPLRSFEDLKGIFSDENIQIVKKLYPDVRDIETFVAMYLENLIEGGWVPQIFYHIVADQLKRNKETDRFWYENPNRPNPLTKRQLAEVRGTSIARMMCDVGDDVTSIQPRAFLIVGPNNERRLCSKIKKIDYSAWADKSCKSGGNPSCGCKR